MKIKKIIKRVNLMCHENIPPYMVENGRVDQRK